MQYQFAILYLQSYYSKCAAMPPSQRAGAGVIVARTAGGDYRNQLYANLMVVGPFSLHPITVSVNEYHARSYLRPTFVSDPAITFSRLEKEKDRTFGRSSEHRLHVFSSHRLQPLVVVLGEG